MCLSPLRIPYPGSTHGIKGRFYLDVPCGYCVECLNQKRNDAIVKIYNELLNCTSCYLTTLTYSDEHVPEVYEVATGEIFRTLCYSDVQSWFKRSRRTCQYHGISIDGFRYFVCGEYGSKTLRPHYHLLLFNLSSSALDRFLADWRENYGFVDCRSCDLSTQSAAKISQYVSKYLTKSKLDCLSPRLNYLYTHKCRKCFCRSSRFFGCLEDWTHQYITNFGLSTCYNELKKVYDFCKISINGFLYKMPKTLKKHFLDWCYESVPNFKKIVSPGGLPLGRLACERSLASLSRLYFTNRLAVEFAEFQNQNVPRPSIDVAYSRFLSYRVKDRCISLEKRLARPLFFDHC